MQLICCNTKEILKISILIFMLRHHFTCWCHEKHVTAFESSFVTLLNRWKYWKGAGPCEVPVKVLECAPNHWSKSKAASVSVVSSGSLTPWLQSSVSSPFIPRYQVMPFSFLHPSRRWLLSWCSLLCALPREVQRGHLVPPASASEARDTQ